MPKTAKSGDAKKSELPSTLRKSSEKAQRTYAKAYDSAKAEYGDERRAHQVAYSALEHGFEKVGDRWEAKPPHAQGKGGKSTNRSAGGVNADATKDHLYAQAKKLNIAGRSTMTKQDLIEALEKESKRSTSRSS